MMMEFVRNETSPPSLVHLAYKLLYIISKVSLNRFSLSTTEAQDALRNNNNNNDDDNHLMLILESIFMECVLLLFSFVGQR